MYAAFEGHSPVIDNKCFVADGCQVIGNVEMLEYSSIWFNSVARADVNKILIGRYSNVQDGSVLHCDDDYPLIIGDYVTVGHKAILHGCTIEDHVLVGMGATILNGAVIGRGCIIGAGAVVKENMVVPPFSMLAGVPAKILKQLPEDTTALHNHAVKYKTLWAKRYAILPEDDGESYED